MRCEHLGVVGRAAHRAQHVGAGVLERDVEVGEDQPLGHQRDDVVDVRVGVDVVEPAPRRRACPARGRGRSCGRGLRAPFHGRGLVADVDAVGRGVLADDQQLLRAGGDQLLGLAQDRVGAAADEVAADDAG